MPAWGASVVCCVMDKSNPRLRLAPIELRRVIHCIYLHLVCCLRLSVVDSVDVPVAHVPGKARDASGMLASGMLAPPWWHMRAAPV